jgi:hypothetical protein
MFKKPNSQLMQRKTQLPYQKAQVLERVGGQRKRTFYQALHLSHKPVQVGECCFPIPHAFVPWAGNRPHDSAITKRHSPFRVYPVRVPILSSRDLKLLSQTFDAVLRNSFYFRIPFDHSLNNHHGKVFRAES